MNHLCYSVGSAPDELLNENLDDWSYYSRGRIDQSSRAAQTGGNDVDADAVLGVHAYQS